MESIFDLLKQDHQRHRELLAKLAETSGDSEERRELFQTFREDVTAHANAEEQSLYAEMMQRPATQDEARHSVAEHKEIDDFLAELAKTDMSSSAWLKKFNDMRHRYEHHIDEEEEDMFPSADDELSNACETHLAQIFADRKPKELAQAEAGIEHDERD